ncbi:MAG: hypothetical protein IKZ99_04320 [Salinivirgaceae bacterium]|nr:hypothetical protein [Salinivirgaceae bacterium]
MKNRFLHTLSAVLFVPLTLFIACETEEEPNENKEKDGNVAKAVIEVGAVTDSEGENLYYDAVTGTRVYMFSLTDWDASETPDVSKAKIVITDENGLATFEFKEEQFNENQNYVFAVKNSTNTFVFSELTLKKEKVANLILYITGEKCKGAKYSNLVKTYKLESIMAQTHLIAGGGILNSDEIIQSIELPTNVTQWYYSFSCNAEDFNGAALNLFSNLLSEFSPAVGIAADVINTLAQPDGTETCDIYLLDEENYRKYINEEPAISLKKNQGVKSGIISEYRYVEPKKYYLLIKNSSFKKISVELEVVAVKETN